MIDDVECGGLWTDYLRCVLKRFGVYSRCSWLGECVVASLCGVVCD